MAKKGVCAAQSANQGALVAQVLLGIASAVRTHAWLGATADRLTPTQGEILVMIQRNRAPMRLGVIASQLGMSCATVSEAVSTLVAKELLAKRRDSVDGRALALCLTPSGARAAKRASRWTEFLSNACAELSPRDLAQLQKTLGKFAQVMQDRGDMPTAESA